VVGGIDTDQDLHVAAVVDRDDGRLVDTNAFSTTRAAYRAMPPTGLLLASMSDDLSSPRTVAT
jgi:hypothetical protein